MEDFKSNIIQTFKETMEKYDIRRKQSSLYSPEPMQSLEEMFFSFANYLIS